jgi:hypothetical protein
MRFLFVLVLVGCFDRGTVPLRDDAAIDAAPDASSALGHCLDSPEAKPPNGQLPCDLLPPGFGQ